MWRNWDPCAGLIGLSNSTPAMENNMKLLKNLDLQLPAISVLSIYPKELKVGLSKDIWTHMFLTALFMMAKKWNHPKCSSVDD